MSKRDFGYLRRLPSKNWQASYQGPDGLRHKPAMTFTRKTEAEAWLAAERHLIETGRWGSPEDRTQTAKAAASKLTFAEYAHSVIEARQRRNRNPLRKSTADNYRKCLRLVVNPTFGKMQLRRITPDAVRAWWASLPDRPTQNANAYAAFRSIMAEAVEEGLISQNPCRLKGAGKPAPKREPKVLAPDVALAYLQAVEPAYRVLLALGLLCSLRSGEIRALRRCDVSDDGRAVRVAQGVTRVYSETADGSRGPREWVIGPPKTAAGKRTVAVPELMSGPLLEAAREHERKGRNPEGLLFPASDGSSPISDASLHRAHKRALARIGLSGVTIHDLRRSGATMAAQSGATIKELMRRLGHTQPGVAMLYQVADDERDRALAGRMGELVAHQKRRWRITSGEVSEIIEADSMSSAVAKFCQGRDVTELSVSAL